RRGDRADDMKSLLKEIVNDYKQELPTERMFEVAQKLDETVRTYIQKVETCLLNAPAIASPAVIEEWRLRLEEVMKQSRFSEVEHTHDWLDIAFGREREGKPQPLDMRIHTRLAELYMKAKKYPKAIEQLDLARQLAPRDIFVLRMLGKAYLDNEDREKANAVLDRIQELDKNAFVHNAECAALQGRWYKSGGDLQKAEEVYASALNHNSESHYLANLLAEVRLKMGKNESAADAFHRALAIIEHLTESNIWTHATAANAAFFIGNDQQASKHLTHIKSLNPDADSISTIEDGLKGIATHIEHGHSRLETFLGALRQ
ncbi:MAG: hypothetical protein OEY57_02440, partial [Nitrospirota bacterium]|nr:hypothetical protein [Nitrospirota bacterium]